MKAEAQVLATALLDSTPPFADMPLRDLLAFGSQVEQAILWADKKTGASCKCKVDAVILALGESLAYCVDLKTTSEPPVYHAIESAAFKWGYHRQAVHYLDGLASEGLVGAEFWFAFVQKDAPHEVMWMRAGDRFLAYGAAEMDKAKRIYAECVALDHWPSAQQQGLLPTVLEAPKWAKVGE